MDDKIYDGRWADWRTTVALTGVRRADLAWALSRGDVRYSTTRLSHEGVLMVSLDDAAGLGHRPQHLRLVRDGE